MFKELKTKVKLSGKISVVVWLGGLCNLCCLAQSYCSGSESDGCVVSRSLARSR